MQVSLRKWFATGSPWVWLNAGAVAISVVLVLGLLGVVATRGLVHFWPASLQEYQFTDHSGAQMSVLGERVQREQVTAEQIRNSGIAVPEDVEILDRQLIKVGNRELYGSDFRWVLERQLSNLTYPENAVTIERREWGNFYGFIVGVKENGELIAEQTPADNDLWQEVKQRTVRATQIYKTIQDLEGGAIGAINYQLEKLRLKERALELKGLDTAENLAHLQAEKSALQAQYASLEKELMDLYTPFKRDSLLVVTADGQQKEINFSEIVRLYQPNSQSLWEKVQHYVMKLLEFVSDDPREANTEGGIFPAIFGTVLMVMIMSLIVTPFGVVAAVYLREYANQGFITRTIRIAVNNLAGVPSIVYGVFGLGFFVYFIGGNLDELFFAPALPSPTFGTPGLLWASLTLALLTLPVVIVATEEGLSRIPRSVREGSLALGATKFETLMRVVIPMASPAMMTGVILAVARAAGEVAPLMLVGVVKLAPNLPLDVNAPFLHLERKFMHLGFHIYDVGFQSPNVEAARPLVYATALMLVVVIAVLNLTAIAIRNRLREKYRALDM
ncbi:phosphate ABC transporter permease PstA [Denitrificimonas sp. JX-1]|uniref:Phosphate transport system permease protein PstA n=1 Tax=Denitrificimonas halotolerans TaxID=3098930 RepID=A0ABU5GQ71_9GAMM|nr:phosphate ABC transporter permease PstA [Denitrificimonas sp. JX-1]MDY7219116.1 phosphate ABC transporter permease PstA [Denitrificimonas sp. JX-1]